MTALLPRRAGFLGFPGWEPSAKERQAEDSGSKDRTLTLGKGGSADRLRGDRAKPDPLLFLAGWEVPGGMGSRLLKWEWGTNVPPTASTVAQAASVERRRIDNKRLSMGRSRGIPVGPSRGPAFLANRPNATVTFEKSAQAFPGCLGEPLDPLEQVFA
jgi:hypothetical protein